MSLRHLPWAVTSALATAGCQEPPPEPPPPTPLCPEDGEVIGGFTAGMDGRECHVRDRETELGNLVADSAWWVVERAELDPRPLFFATNSGSIAVDWNWTAEELHELRAEQFWVSFDGSCRSWDELLLFPNTFYLVTMPIVNLRRLLERSFGSGSGLGAFPNATGSFLLLSGNARLVVDLSRTAQVTGEEAPFDILTEGDRVVSLTVDGAEVDLASTDETITFATVDWMLGVGEPNGPDGGFISYPAVHDGPVDRVSVLGGSDASIALGEYLRDRSPITPALDGRVEMRNLGALDLDLCEPAEP